MLHQFEKKDQKTGFATGTIKAGVITITPAPKPQGQAISIDQE